MHEKNGENVLKLQNREKHEDTHISAPDAKILVVDDVETNRIVVKELLRVTDINVEVASSGEMCLELMKNNKSVTKKEWSGAKGQRCRSLPI